MKRYETISIAVAAAIEAGTGLILISFPSLFVRLLLGVELSEPGQIVGRLAGFALIALVLACWPRGGTEGAAASSLRALLASACLSLRPVDCFDAVCRDGTYRGRTVASDPRAGAGGRHSLVVAAAAQQYRSSILRLLDILALELLAALAMRPESRLVLQAFGRFCGPLGRHSLPVFAIGIIASTLGNVWFMEVGRGLISNFIVNASGLSAMFGVAWLASWLKGRPWDVKKNSAAPSAGAKSRRFPISEVY